MASTFQRCIVFIGQFDKHSIRQYDAEVMVARERESRDYNFVQLCSPPDHMHQARKPLSYIDLGLMLMHLLVIQPVPSGLGKQVAFSPHVFLSLFAFDTAAFILCPEYQ